MKVTGLIVAGLMVVSLGGCATGIGPKQGIGTAAGAVGGALLGSQIGGGKGKIVAGVVGGLLGAALGGEIGAQLDQRDKLLANQSLYQGLEYGRSGAPVSWKNPDSGHSGVVTTYPVRHYNNRVCRSYKSTAFIAGKAETVRGTACRRSDGTWDIAR